MNKEEFLAQLNDMGRPADPLVISEVVPQNAPHVVAGTLFVAFEDGPLSFSVNRDDGGRMVLFPSSMISDEASIEATLRIGRHNLEEIMGMISKEWRVNGLRHRLDGPAIEWANGTREWWVNGLRHPNKEEEILPRPPPPSVGTFLSRIAGRLRRTRRPRRVGDPQPHPEGGPT